MFSRSEFQNKFPHLEIVQVSQNKEFYIIDLGISNNLNRAIFLTPDADMQVVVLKSNFWQSESLCYQFNSHALMAPGDEGMVETAVEVDSKAVKFRAKYAKLSWLSSLIIKNHYDRSNIPIIMHFLNVPDETGAYTPWSDVFYLKEEKMTTNQNHKGVNP